MFVRAFLKSNRMIFVDSVLGYFIWRSISLQRFATVTGIHTGNIIFEIITT